MEFFSQRGIYAVMRQYNSSSSIGIGGTMIQLADPCESSLSANDGSTLGIENF